MATTRRELEQLARASPKDVLWISDWKCPAHIPEAQLGDYRVIRKRKQGGFYPMHGVMGYTLVYVAAPYFWVTRLQERQGQRWHDWMTDDPLYWHSMAHYAHRSSGNVLVLGLGLGLIVRHLQVAPQAKRVWVVERSREVSDLVLPHLPTEKVELVLADFYDAAPKLAATRFDSIVMDLLVGTPGPKMRKQFDRAFDTISHFWPDAAAFYHGVGEWAQERLLAKQIESALKGLQAHGSTQG